MAGHHEGRGPTIEQALKDAYKVAREAGENPPFVVDTIELHGNNPFTEFKVKVRPGP